jgi:hypothetical protein
MDKRLVTALVVIAVMLLAVGLVLARLDRRETRQVTIALYDVDSGTAGGEVTFEVPAAWGAPDDGDPPWIHRYEAGCVAFVGRDLPAGTASPREVADAQLGASHVRLVRSRGRRATTIVPGHGAATAIRVRGRYAVLVGVIVRDAGCSSATPGRLFPDVVYSVTSVEIPAGVPPGADVG